MRIVRSGLERRRGSSLTARGRLNGPSARLRPSSPGHCCPGDHGSYCGDCPSEKTRSPVTPTDTDRRPPPRTNPRPPQDKLTLHDRFGKITRPRPRRTDRSHDRQQRNTPRRPVAQYLSLQITSWMTALLMLSFVMTTASVPIDDLTGTPVRSSPHSSPTKTNPLKS